MKKQAVLIISGKLLECSFPLDALDELRRCVEDELASRGVMTTRCVVTLGSMRHIAAQIFLGAGFETVPADDEDVQTALAMFSAVYSENPPDEIVFALGLNAEPVNLTRSLAGRVELTSLRFPGVNDAAPSSRPFQQSICQTLDVRELFKNHGCDWDAHESAPWDVWSDRIDMLLSGAFEPKPIVVAQPPAPAAPEPEVVPPPEPRVAVTYEEAMRRENVAKFTELAPEWNQAILDYLAGRDHRCSAIEVAEALDGRFPGLCNFSMKYRDEFRQLLCESLYLFVEDRGVMFLYDKEHPAVKPDPDALTRLDVGSQAEREEQDYSNQTNYAIPPSLTFSEISARAGLSRDYCEALAKRKEDPENSPFFETINDDFAAKGRALGCDLWLERSPLAHDARVLRELADGYDLLERSTSFFDLVAQNAAELPLELVVRASRLVATSQCLLKTILRDVGIPLGVDGPQREAFSLLRYFLESFDLRRPLNHMRRDEFVRLDDRAGFLDECEATREEVVGRVEFNKARKKAWEKLEYYVESLKESRPENALNYWARIVETTTELCDRFDEPYSSVRLRDLLMGLVDLTPEEVETTDAFCCVVQAIDEYVENEQAQAANAFQPDVGPAEPSEAILAVRKRFAGSKLVFIGGTPQDHFRKRLERAFQVEVEWSHFDHGDSLERFGAYLRDPDVKLFVVYIPWCSHKHSEELVALIKEFNKDYVRQKKGTNPEVIALSICDQLSLLDNAARADRSDRAL